MRIIHMGFLYRAFQDCFTLEDTHCSLLDLVKFARSTHLCGSHYVCFIEQAKDLEPHSSWVGNRAQW